LLNVEERVERREEKKYTQQENENKTKSQYGRQHLKAFEEHKVGMEYNTPRIEERKKERFGNFYKKNFFSTLTEDLRSVLTVLWLN
jgi:hypothetical protein